VVMLLVGLQFDRGGGPESRLLLKLFHPGSWKYDFTFDLTTGGQVQTIDRVMECKPWFVHSDAGGYKPGWYTGKFAVSHRENDNSGVLVIAPQFCMAYRPPSDNYRPVIFWTPNVQHIDELEGYFDVMHVQPDQHASVANVRLVAPSNRESAEYPDEFADYFSLLRRSPQPAGRRITFYSFRIYELPKEVWHDKAEVAETLRSESAPAVLQQSTVLRILISDPRTEPPADYSFLTGGWYATAEVPSLYDRKNLRTALRTLDGDALKIVDGRLVQEHRGTGVYPYQPESTLIAALHDHKITLQGFGTSLDLPYSAGDSQWFVWDPGTETLFMILLFNANIYLQ